MHRADLIESQLESWRNRPTPQPINGQMIDVHTSIELQEQLQAFIRGDQARIQEIREVITSVEERANIMRRSRDDTLEVISNGVTSEVDRLSVTLTERMAEVESAVKT